MTTTWEILLNEGDAVRRAPVPGGYLYQVQNGLEHVRGAWQQTWHPPVFVPEQKKPRVVDA